MKNSIIAALLVLGLILGIACGPGAGTTTTTTSPALTTSTPRTTTATPAGTPGPAVTIDLTAQNMAFDKNTITVPAGAQVTINFNNKDSAIPHNFAAYTDQSAATAIFQGQTIIGPNTATYKFTAPSKPGDYFFRCDAHPIIMTGTFTVTAGGPG